MNFGPIRNGTVPNFMLYMPTQLDQIKTMSVNLELIVRVESNFKFDLRHDKQSYLPNDQMHTNEVHFLRMEGILQEIDVTTTAAIFSLQKSIGVDVKRQVQDWQITDLDHYL